MVQVYTFHIAYCYLYISSIHTHMHWQQIHSVKYITNGIFQFSIIDGHVISKWFHLVTKWKINKSNISVTIHLLAENRIFQCLRYDLCLYVLFNWIYWFKSKSTSFQWIEQRKIDFKWKEKLSYWNCELALKIDQTLTKRTIEMLNW